MPITDTNFVEQNEAKRQMELAELMKSLKGKEEPITKKLAAVILAAGLGKRMKSPEKPKVMFEICGRPMIQYVVELALGVNADKIIPIVGHHREQVINLLDSIYPGKGIEYAVQEQQNGTGHAVMQTESLLKDFDGEVLILSGDVPLLKLETLEALIDEHFTNNNDATLLTTVFKNSFGYGRIVRDENNNFLKIVEEKDASEEERKIKEINPDIIHLHNLHGYYINIEILFNFLKNYKGQVVWTLYDCWSFTGHCTYFDMVECNRWKTACYNCPQKTAYPASYIFDNSSINYQRKKKIFNQLKNLTIVVHSNWLHNTIKKSFLRNFPAVIINNGINTVNFKPKEIVKLQIKLKVVDKFVILGIAAQWVKRKGFDDFIELSKFLKEDEIIVLDGVSDKQRINLPSNIIVSERARSVEELAELYSLADVFVNPSHEDNFPTTNLESLACGTPIIVYNTGGSPEAVDTNTGIVVETGNISGIVEAISIIKANGKSKYYNNCIERATAKYNYLDRYKDYITLFEKII